LLSGVEQLKTGADTLNTGIQDLNDKGLSALSKQVKGLTKTVTGDKSFDVITDGFALVDSSIEGVIEGIGDWTNPLANGKGNGSGPYLTSAGKLDTSKATLARGLWSLIYGVRTQDIPADSASKDPSSAIGGLTNPDCVQTKKNPAGTDDNPCGAWQAADTIKKGLTDTAVPAIAAIAAGIGGVVEGLDKGDPNSCDPLKGECGAGQVLQQVAGGLAQISAGIAADGPLDPPDPNDPAGLASFLVAINDVLTLGGFVDDCDVKQPGTDAGTGDGLTEYVDTNGWTGPLILPKTGNPLVEAVCAGITGLSIGLFNAAPSTISVDALTAGPYGAANPLLNAGGPGVPAPFVTNTPGIAATLGNQLLPGSLSFAVSATAAGLITPGAGTGTCNIATTSPPDSSNCSVVEILDFFQKSLVGKGGVNDGLNGAATGLASLQKVVTSKASGQPDATLDPNDVTATGLLNQYRTQFALGGAGSDGKTGQCAGYKPAGDPNGDLNTDATEALVKETCAVADILNISLKVSKTLETGVSTTLLDGISETFEKGIGSYSEGCEVTKTLGCAIGTLAAKTPELADKLGLLQRKVAPLPGALALAASGAGQIAAGLPAAVAGITKLQDGGVQLAGTAAPQYETASLSLATFDAMAARTDSGAGIPGGAPTGVTTYGGAYAWFLDGAGGEGSGNAVRFALALLALIGAGAIGVGLARRAAV
jgi:X-X-X-Leu-X-X-Gly heptad repeat protein